MSNNRRKNLEQALELAKNHHPQAWSNLRQVYEGPLTDFANTRGIDNPSRFVDNITTEISSAATTFNGSQEQFHYLVCASAYAQLKKQNIKTNLQLSKRQEIVMMLRVFIGLSPSETASAMGMDLDQTKDLEEETRVDLARYLGTPEDEDSDSIVATTPPLIMASENEEETNEPGMPPSELLIATEPTEESGGRYRVLAVAAALLFIVGGFLIYTALVDDSSIKVAESDSDETQESDQDDPASPTVSSTRTTALEDDSDEDETANVGPTRADAIDANVTSTTSDTSPTSTGATAQTSEKTSTTRPATTTTERQTTTSLRPTTTRQTTTTTRFSTSTVAPTTTVTQPASYSGRVLQASYAYANNVVITLTNADNTYRANVGKLTFNFRSIEPGCYTRTTDVDTTRVRVCFNNGQQISGAVIFVPELTPPPTSCAIDSSRPASVAGVTVVDSPLQDRYIFLDSTGRGWIADTSKMDDNYEDVRSGVRKWNARANDFDINDVESVLTKNEYGISAPVSCSIS